jgi:hypothetical protein
MACFQFFGFEKRQTEIEPQAGHGRLERQRLAVERHGFLVVPLPRLQQAKVGVCFR